MVFEITDPFCIQVLRGVEEGLYKAEYLLILTYIQNHHFRLRRHLEMLIDRRLKGIVAEQTLCISKLAYWGSLYRGRSRWRLSDASLAKIP